MCACEEAEHSEWHSLGTKALEKVVEVSYLRQKRPTVSKETYSVKSSGGIVPATPLKPPAAALTSPVSFSPLGLV